MDEVTNEINEKVKKSKMNDNNTQDNLLHYWNLRGSCPNPGLFVLVERCVICFVSYLLLLAGYLASLKLTGIYNYLLYSIISY